MDARQLSYHALMQWRRAGLWPQLSLKRAEGVSAPDMALASSIIYGIVENRGLIDYTLGLFSKTPPGKLDPRLLDVLRIGAYQLLFLDKVPKSAAVNEAVKLTRTKVGPQAAGLVNAVLRRVGELDGPPEPKADDPAVYLSIKYSHPEWLVRRFLDLFGRAGCEALLKCNNAPVEHTARVNTLKTSTDALLTRLREEGCVAEIEERLENCVRLPQLKPALDSRAFKEGQFAIQDIASQLSVRALGPKPGGLLIDLCAAPGGKTLLAAQYMQNQGEIIACDLSEKKVEEMRTELKRYGVNPLRVLARDAQIPEPDWAGKADFVICDVVCSGTGVIRKKPDIRYKSEDELRGLPELQARILSAGLSYLKPGGRLLYSTCTILPEENGQVIERVLAERKDIRLADVDLSPFGAAEGEGLTLYPHIHGTDGFYIAILEKNYA